MNKIAVAELLCGIGNLKKTHMRQQIKKILFELKSFKQNIWIYTKYFIIIKILLFFFIIPIYYRSALFLISSTGQKALTSGNFKLVMMTPQGAVLIILTCIFFVLYISMDINTSILISSAFYEDKKSQKLSDILKQGFKSARIFLSPIGLLFMIYAVLIVPLVGIGITTSITKGFKIPRFITSVIYNNGAYLTIYGSVLVILTVMSFFMIFTFHYILLRKEKVMNATRKSIKLVSNNIKDLVSHLIIITVGLILTEMIIAKFGHLVLALVEFCLGSGTYSSRFFMILVLIISLECIQVLVFFFVPLEIHSLTIKFYEYRGDIFGNENIAMPKARKRRKKTIFLIVILLLNISISGIFALFFDEFFHRKSNTVIVAHRGGGDLGPENTIKGIGAAVKNGASWSEIDVQRAKDGKYIINHDSTFGRLTGDDRNVSEMTWEQIKKLHVKYASRNSKDNAKVPSLNDTMDFAKGNIGLLIELKGKSADKKMADDVVRAIKKKRMEKEAVVIGLDYELIEYVEKTYPEIKTGYLYFFVVGDVSRFNTDYLIMEEDIVNKDVVQNLHKADKKVLVWTVNREESVAALINAEVDGIITDNIKGVRKVIEAEKNKKDIDIIIEKIQNVIE